MEKRLVSSRKYAAVLAVASLLAFAVPAIATAADDSVDGDSPYAIDCTKNVETVTSQSTEDGSALVEVRYSADCGVAWARVQLKNEEDVARTYNAGIHREEDGAVQTCDVTDDKSESLDAYSCYTPVLGTDGATFYATVTIGETVLTTETVSAPTETE